MTENGTARRGVADPYNALMTGVVETLVSPLAYAPLLPLDVARGRP